MWREISYLPSKERDLIIEHLLSKIVERHITRGIYGSLTGTKSLRVIVCCCTETLDSYLNHVVNRNWASDHWPFLVLGTTGIVSGKTLEPGSYNTGKYENTCKIWTVAPWVIYSDKSTVCTFPHPSLYSFLSFLCQRSPIPREEVGPPNQNFQEVSSFSLRLWDFHQISVCVNTVNTLVESGQRKGAWISSGNTICQSHKPGSA